MRETSAEEVKIEGTVRSVVFRNEETDWSVLHVQTKTGLARITGVTSAKEGQRVIARCTPIGRRAVSKYSRETLVEYKAASIVATYPQTARGVALFLAQHVRGIGKGRAQKIADHFGDDLVHIIEHDPQRLCEVKGVSAEAAEAARQVWQQERESAEIMAFLLQHEITPGAARRIVKRYGREAQATIKEDPYVLAREVKGIGFTKADAIAAQLGVSRLSPNRLSAAVLHVLQQASSGGGHCGLPRAELLRQAQDLLQVDASAIEPHIELAKSRGFCVEEGGILWLASLFHMERAIEAKVRKLQQAGPLRRLSDEAYRQKLAADAAAACGVQLSEKQLSGVLMALSHRISVLTGGPGCGKTTTLKAIIEAYRRARVRFALACPTGKAAKRASESTGMEAATLHRLMGIGENGASKCPDVDIIVIDEASMVDVPLMSAVMGAMQPHMGLLLVGDVDQLPSVGPGNVLRDLIERAGIACTRLDVIYRQGAGSRIIEASHAINKGRLPFGLSSEKQDFFVISAKNCERLAQAAQQEESAIYAQAAHDEVLDLVCRRLPTKYGLHPRDDIMVLAPTNKGRCGVEALNKSLQAALNPGNGGVQIARYLARAGDKVMQIRNNYDLGVFNGDSGVLLEIDAAGKRLIVQMDDRVVEYPQDCADDLTLAYAITIHKSQGSQAPCVVMPLLTEHFTLLQRNLVYTGITRAQRLCVMVTHPKALSMAVNRQDSVKRHTSLFLAPQRKTAPEGAVERIAL